jgi:hypothetical protein
MIFGFSIHMLFILLKEPRKKNQTEKQKLNVTKGRYSTKHFSAVHRRVLFLSVVICRRRRRHHKELKKGKMKMNYTTAVT